MQAKCRAFGFVPKRSVLSYLCSNRKVTMAKKKAAMTKDDKKIKASIDDFMAKYRALQQEAENEARNALKTIAHKLRKQSVAVIYAEYNGSGDSGDIEEVTYFDAKNKQLTTKELAKCTDEVKDICFKFLPGGFEINEGSYGTVIIDLEKSTLTVQNNERIEQVNYTENTQAF